jgi:tetratricopeptide (TPR) repeat protein
MQKYAEAESDFSRAIQYLNSNPDYFFNRALTRFILELNDAACSDLEKAAELGDEDAKAYLEEFCNGL